MIALPDVNLLLALAWPQHIHYVAADAWFTRHRVRSWATCPHTQLGFVLRSARPAVVGATVSVGDAMQILTENTAAPDHVFWEQATALTAILGEIRGRRGGPQQLADALLLDLAIRRGGRLATLDRRLADSLRPGSRYGQHLTVVPSELS